MSAFTIAELVDEAERECHMRARVYQRQVSAGNMTQSAADRGINLMREIAENLRRQLPPPAQREML